MKTTNLITLCVFLATFLVGGVALADDSGVFDSVSSDSALEAPKLTVAIDGVKVTLSWNNVTGASYYVVHYAQAPYDHPGTIKTIDVDEKTSAVYNLFPGCAYHVAVKACDASGFNCSDYSIIHDVKIPIVSSFKNSLGQEFKLIPAGTFTMGSPTSELGRNDDETQHQVTLTQPFYMQTTEVTQAQWETVMGSNPSSFSGCPTCSVEQVSWNDVKAFITKMNTLGEGTYGLPTEAQWEYAARAGSTTAFYNGGITELGCRLDANLNAIGWYCHNSGGKTHTVAGKTPNAWGLYDMSGNVWEWCSDWFGAYSNSPTEDPQGPSTGSFRVVRGGSWYYYGSAFCRSACRGNLTPYYRYGYVGFRLVFSSDQQ
jgi:formylglycine-generating enzyme required for sulfatase activity